MANWQRRDMSGREFKLSYRALGLSQGAMARWLGVSEATARRYVKEAAPIPPSQAMLIRLVRKHNEMVLAPPYRGIRAQRLAAKKLGAAP